MLIENIVNINITEYYHEGKRTYSERVAKTLQKKGFKRTLISTRLTEDECESDIRLDVPRFLDTREIANIISESLTESEEDFNMNYIKKMHIVLSRNYMNPILLVDGYKMSHIHQYPEGTTLVYSNLTARELFIIWKIQNKK